MLSHFESFKYSGSVRRGSLIHIFKNYHLSLKIPLLLQSSTINKYLKIKIYILFCFLLFFPFLFNFPLFSRMEDVGLDSLATIPVKNLRAFGHKRSPKEIDKFVNSQEISIMTVVYFRNFFYLKFR
jgi:hypothetical protein